MVEFENTDTGVLSDFSKRIVVVVGFIDPWVQTKLDSVIQNMKNTINTQTIIT